MPRRKLVIKKMDDRKAMVTTFRNRKKGLLKKAEELSILCGCDVGAIVFSAVDATLEHFPKSSVDPIIERYQKFQDARRANENHTLDLTDENERLSKNHDEEEPIFSQMDGKALENLSIEQLRRLKEKTQNYLNLISAKLEKQERRVKELEHTHGVKNLEILDVLPLYFIPPIDHRFDLNN